LKLTEEIRMDVTNKSRDDLLGHGFDDRVRRRSICAHVDSADVDATRLNRPEEFRRPIATNARSGSNWSHLIFLTFILKLTNERRSSMIAKQSIVDAVAASVG
jgi:hypothetical protein